MKSVQKPLETDFTLKTLKWFSNGYFHVNYTRARQTFLV
jgi:hypothetical protein